jgi:hypothetical protein
MHLEAGRECVCSLFAESLDSVRGKMIQRADSIEKDRPVPSRSGIVHQFLVVLNETVPLVWRRIQVPEDYSFWDLHVAIQDSMGWLDYHLHQFVVFHPPSGDLEYIGIPDEDDFDDPPVTPGWEVRISDFFIEEIPPATYLYDFGDNWRHTIVYEGVWPVEPAVSYPVCIAGARACPPEDCGGVRGYTEFLDAVLDPTHALCDDLIELVDGPFDPDEFDPKAVMFDDPEQRWINAFLE